VTPSDVPDAERLRAIIVAVLSAGLLLGALFGLLVLAGSRLRPDWTRHVLKMVLIFAATFLLLGLLFFVVGGRS
jgi:hypothetical protein